MTGSDVAFHMMAMAGSTFGKLRITTELGEPEEVAHATVARTNTADLPNSGLHLGQRLFVKPHTAAVQRCYCSAAVSVNCQQHLEHNARTVAVTGVVAKHSDNDSVCQKTMKKAVLSEQQCA